MNPVIEASKDGRLKIDVGLPSKLKVRVPDSSKPQGDITKNLRYTYILKQDLNHPRRDNVNYVVALTDQRLDTYSQFDTSSIITDTKNLMSRPSHLLQEYLMELFIIISPL